MSQQQQNPKATNTVLGGQTTPQQDFVLGEIEELKRRLKSSNQQKRIAALQQAINYGEKGLKFVQEAQSTDKIKLAESGHLPREFLYTLAQDQQIDVCWAVARNPNAPAELLYTLAQADAQGILSGVAENPNTPRELLYSLAQNQYREVRRKVASNPNAPVELLYTLAQASAPGIRSGVAANPNVPSELLHFLAQDQEVLVRGAANRTLRKVSGCVVNRHFTDSHFFAL